MLIWSYILRNYSHANLSTICPRGVALQTPRGWKPKTSMSVYIFPSQSAREMYELFIKNTNGHIILSLSTICYAWCNKLVDLEHSDLS